MFFILKFFSTWTKNRKNTDPILLKNYVTQRVYFHPLLRHITQSRIIVVLQEVAYFRRLKSSRREQSPSLIFFQSYVFSTGGSKDYGRKAYTPPYFQLLAAQHLSSVLPMLENTEVQTRKIPTPHLVQLRRGVKIWQPPVRHYRWLP